MFSTQLFDDLGFNIEREWLQINDSVQQNVLVQQNWKQSAHELKYGKILKNPAFSDATCICLRKKCQGDILFIMRLHFDFEQRQQAHCFHLHNVDNIQNNVHFSVSLITV